VTAPCLHVTAACLAVVLYSPHIPTECVGVTHW
jgi:hypothetical protein